MLSEKRSGLYAIRVDSRHPADQGERTMNVSLMRGALVSTFLVSGLAVGIALAQDVRTDFDHKANFGNYHTYSWGKVQTTNPLWQDRIEDAVDKELQAKGWQKTPTGGDVMITAIGATENQQEYQTFYDGLGPWRWRGFGETTTVPVTYRVGTLVLDMYDASSKQLVFRAIAQNTISHDTERNEKNLSKAVDKIFKKFPPEEGK